jgi:uncharacterized membrane protein (UPF0127 family)
MKRLAALVAGLAMLLAAGSAARADTGRLLDGFPRARAMIETPLACHLLDIWIAETPEQRARGLMFIRQLGEYEGMLFPGREPAILRMWMKNTYIPLDMLFIGADARIIGIAERTTPLSEATISSPGPALAVLELNGGFAARHGIGTGDRFATY